MAINYREILDTYRNLQEEANRANQQRYNQLLGTIDTGRDTVMDLLGDLGESQFGRIDQTRQRERGRAEQDLISRGLGNTTIRESVLRGVEDDAQRAQSELTEQISRQKAGAETDFTRMLASAIEGRSDVGPDLAMMAQLMQQAASGPSGTLHTGLSANARAGRDAFGNPMGRYSSGGGGTSGYGLTGGGSGGGGTSRARSFRKNAGGGYTETTPGIAGGGGGGGGVSGAYRSATSSSAARQAGGGGFGRIGPAGSPGGQEDGAGLTDLMFGGPVMAPSENDAFYDLADLADLSGGGGITDGGDGTGDGADGGGATEEPQPEKESRCPKGKTYFPGIGCF